jgi:hypothetical protein
MDINDSLKKLINLSSIKYSCTLKTSSVESDFRINFPVPIILDNDLNYELGLMWFTSYNTIYNVSPINNILKWSKDNGVTWITHELHPGAYEIKEINDEIFKFTTSTKEVTFISIKPQLSTGKIILKLHDKVQVDFNHQNSLRELLGFTSKIYNQKENIAENLAKITHINDINIECDLVSGNYTNGKLDNILYSFPANTVPLGYKFIERMNPPNYLPINRKRIDSIHIRILDQDGNIINFNTENLNMCLHLKQV